MSDSHTLLIVDDCPEDRDIYREYLSGDPTCSYDFIEASLAEVGLELFYQTRFDAILLDFWMPDMDGLEFLNELQRRRATVSTDDQPPIIMLTGQGNEAIAVKAIKQGVQDYLVKHHLRPEDLRLAVRTVIQKSQIHSLSAKMQEQQRLVATTALRMRQSLDIEQILATTVLEVQQLLECDHVAIYYTAGEHQAEIRAQWGHRETLPDWTSINCNLKEAIASPTTISRSSLSSPSKNRQLSHSANINPQVMNIYAHTHGDLIAAIIMVPGMMTTAQQSDTHVFDLYVSDSHMSDSNGHQCCNGNVWGYLVAHQSAKVTPWRCDEQRIVSELAAQLAIAIHQSELLTQTQTAYEKSQNLNYFKSQILATVSHEYRTPLSTILAAATTLEQHGQQLAPERKTRFLQMIQDKARRMTTLTDQMLVMHQCELSQAQLQSSPINVLQFIADLVEEHRDIVNDAHDIVLTVAGKTNGFWGDAGLLRLAVDNVLSNAIKYSPQGGIIEVSLVGRVTGVQISIQDDGIGIPLNEQQNLLQSFTRGSNVRMIPGTGLGLAIVKACIDLYGGDITLESDENKGTKVVLFFPKQANRRLSNAQN